MHGYGLPLIKQFCCATVMSDLGTFLSIYLYYNVLFLVLTAKGQFSSHYYLLYHKFMRQTEVSKLQDTVMC